MNTVAVSDNQTTMILVACLAVLHSSNPNQEKIAALESVLMARILNSSYSIPFVITGLPIIDEAVVGFASMIETRLKSLDLTQISTGSPNLDQAFANQLSEIISINFSEQVVS